MKHCAGQIKYLIAIKELTDKDEYVRCVSISRHLGVSRPSVSKMLRCLANCGYVYEDFCNSNHNTYDTPFVSLGINYIRFAKKEQNIFRLLFLSGNKNHTLYELINGNENAFVMKEIKKIPNLNMDNVELIFTKVFIFMHGMAGMTITGEFDLTDKEAEDMLKDAIIGFIG